MKQGKDRSVIGRWIRTKRKERGWTQAELASRCGLTDNGAVNSWENRKDKRPSDENLVALARAFGTTWLYLKYLTEQDRTPAVSEALRAELGGTVPELADMQEALHLDGVEVVQFIQMLRPLSPEQRQRLTGYLEAKAEEIKSRS